MNISKVNAMPVVSFLKYPKPNVYNFFFNKEAHVK